jgi:hypothetical protein
MTKRIGLLFGALLLSVQSALGGGTTALAPAIQRGLDLRARYGVPVATGTVLIYVDAAAVHHTSLEYITVATRDDSGRWTISTAGEEGPGLLAIAPKAIAETRRTLSAEKGRSLDQLLANPDLYRERDPESAAPGVGAPHFVMEIAAPQGHLIMTWYGRLLLNAGKVADVVIGDGR